MRDPGDEKNTKRNGRVCVYTCSVYQQKQMILRFRNRASESFFMGALRGKAHRRYGDAALRKLDMLDRAHRLEDVKIAPTARLKRLVGDRRGQHSIHLNDRWRICFVWTKLGPADVEIVDYHRPKAKNAARRRKT
jgi:toxin HigB-1